jgi:hypothetical protein
MRFPAYLSRARVFALIAGLVAIESAGAGPFLENGSFEQVSGSPVGQGILPIGWHNDFTPTGADTYSVDGSYGLLPNAFDNFTNALAQDGIRWVAGAHFSNGRKESFSHILSMPLTAGERYEISAFLRGGIGRNAHGTFEVFLSESQRFSDEASYPIGEFSPFTSNSTEWVERRFEFVAPDFVDSLLYLQFVPRSQRLGVTSYTAIDNIDLQVAVPETSSLLLTSLVLGGACLLRWRRGMAL